MNRSSNFYTIIIFFCTVIMIVFSKSIPAQNIKMNLSYLSYFGSPGSEDGSAMFIDKSGAIFLSGNTNSQLFPATQNAYDETFNGGGEDGYGGDVNVSKISSDGADLIYSSFIGGSQRESHTYFNTVDDEGNIYITGHTQSNDFPITAGAYDVSYNENGDIFVFKLDSTGSNLIWATYLGGSGDETPWGLTVDKEGNVYVAGRTNSSNFPITHGAFNTTYNGGYISFVTKINSAGTQLVYSTLLGGSNVDGGYGVFAIGKIFVNENEEVYLVSNANTNYTTTPSVYDASFNGGDWDVYLAKLNSTGSALLFGTYFGGSGSERPTDLLIDNNENIYIAGNSFSSNLPTTAGAYQKNYGGGSQVIYGGDAFIAKFSSTCDSLLYCTYMGKTGDENTASIFLSPSGNLFFSMNTKSSGLFTSDAAYDKTLSGESDIYLCRFDKSLKNLEYASYFGGNGSDFGGIFIDSENNLYIAGGTTSTNLPVTTNALQKNYKGNVDMFYSKFNFTIETGVNEKESSIPSKIYLNQNYPNPFNPSTIIGYHLPKAGNVELSIFNLLGQKIKTLVDSFQNAEVHSTVWNGMDDSNTPVSSGVYFYLMEAEEQITSKKMILMR